VGGHRAPGGRSWGIKPQDGLGFTVLCECAATYAAAVVDLYAQGKVLINPKTGMPHKNPLVAVVETARRDLLRLLREFALTPLAETLLGKLPVPDDDDDDLFGWEATS
jgi:P27 family predicted phage terminase small subunit